MDGGVTETARTSPYTVRPDNLVCGDSARVEMSHLDLLRRHVSSFCR